MAKRSSFSRDDFPDLEGEFEETEEIAEEITVSEPEQVLVRNLIPSRVKWRSPKTGKLYRWGGSGAEVKVLKEDVAFLLAHKRKGCCGAPESASFELVE